MSFFKKIFGGENKETKTTELKNQNTTQEVKVKRSIFDFFEIDFKTIPDDSFIEAEVETNESGKTVQNFRKTISYKECGIFDTIEVKVIDGSNKNVFLKTFNPSRVKFDNLKKLIDELYLIHGNDSDDKGKFTNKDLEDYNDTEFYMLFGRSWSDYSKYKYPVVVGRDEDEVSISIWGIDK
ncbi:MAG: hypothetical protein K8R58_14670 [Bacteroidales bacterium]|nr:hypothetical protein [Bacteroidales bacterium]